MGDINTDYFKRLRELQIEDLERKEEQQEMRREAEAILLDVPDLREYMTRREAQPFLVVEPDLPLDEMTPEDYIKTRDRQEQEAREGPPEMGTSYGEYLDERDEQK